MRSLEWLIYGLHRGEGSILLDETTARLHPEESRLSEGEEPHLQVVEHVLASELTDQEMKIMASEMRWLLFDHFGEEFLTWNGRFGSEHSRRLRGRARLVHGEDHLGFVQMAVEELSTPEEAVYPIHASYVQWKTERNGVIVLSVGADALPFFSLAVAPFAEFGEEERDEVLAGYYPLLERRWREIPDWSFQKSVVVALSGDLEELASLEFVDRSRIEE